MSPSPAKTNVKRYEGTTMTMEVEPRGNALLITPHGRLAEMEGHQLERELLNLIDQGASRLVIDLSDVPFITSTCLGALMLAHKRVRAANGYVHVACAQPLVCQILEITKLTKLFGPYGAIDEALREK